MPELSVSLLAGAASGSAYCAPSAASAGWLPVWLPKHCHPKATASLHSRALAAMAHVWLRISPAGSQAQAGRTMRAATHASGLRLLILRSAPSCPGRAGGWAGPGSARAPRRAYWGRRPGAGPRSGTAGPPLQSAAGAAPPSAGRPCHSPAPRTPGTSARMHIAELSSEQIP